MQTLITNYILLMIYSFLGWLCESLYVSFAQQKVINSGFMNGPICPIYGFGAMLVILFLQPFTKSLLLIFILGVVLTSSLEYFTSWLMEVLFHTRWWDYSQFRINLNGRICLFNSILFGLMSLFVVYYLNPAVMNTVNLIPYTSKLFIALTLFLAFLIDFISSLAELRSFDRDIQKFEDAVKDIKLQLKELSIDFNQLELREQFNSFMDLNDERITTLKQHLNARYEKIANTQEDFHSRLKNAFPQLKITVKKDSLNTISNYLKDRIKKITTGLAGSFHPPSKGLLPTAPEVL